MQAWLLYGSTVRKATIQYVISYLFLVMTFFAPAAGAAPECQRKKWKTEAEANLAVKICKNIFNLAPFVTLVLEGPNARIPTYTANPVLLKRRSI